MVAALETRQYGRRGEAASSADWLRADRVRQLELSQHREMERRVGCDGVFSMDLEKHDQR